MLDQLESLDAKYQEIEAQLQDPAVVSDMKRLRELTKLRSELEPVVEAWHLQRTRLRQLEEAEQILADKTQDAELREMAGLEIPELKEAILAGEAALRQLLVPKDPKDERNVILEVRAGTGGEEAALFAAEIFRMYVRFAERRGYRVSVLSESEADQGGLREVVAEVEGAGAYSLFRFESGVHRVQRVPKTETQGRIHTSACTVAVMPEADEVDIEVKKEDLRIDTFCSGGKGGQSVNTTYSAVRLTHLPTNTVVQCQDERSQLKNMAKAMTVLRSRLLEKAQAEVDQAEASLRKTQVGSGDRSEKIRTYNFPQGRVTDHRVNVTIHQLDSFMQGMIEPILEPLRAAHEAERLQQLEA
ncbi:peptide chain release factor 1 [Mesoterricola silvestris]|uniref:Peptide chain release factor 1 n=1 Tax=Mesoterricola silvestris TaxID=2927979 RepID=A0AA48GJY0_9BACT|nr:peptide chain release factor 1 [Mesoterricola silvestris]BDU74396.1 peptide chain release factor 1 [Mesoterricola silvestris]